MLREKWKCSYILEMLLFVPTAALLLRRGNGKVCGSDAVNIAPSNPRCEQVHIAF